MVPTQLSALLLTPLVTPNYIHTKSYPLSPQFKFVRKLHPYLVLLGLDQLHLSTAAITQRAAPHRPAGTPCRVRDSFKSLDHVKHDVSKLEPMRNGGEFCSGGLLPCSNLCTISWTSIAVRPLVSVYQKRATSRRTRIHHRSMHGRKNTPAAPVRLREQCMKMIPIVAGHSPSNSHRMKIRKSARIASSEQ